MAQEIRGYFPPREHGATEIRVRPAQTIRVEGVRTLEGRLPRDHPLSDRGRGQVFRYIGSKKRGV